MSELELARGRFVDGDLVGAGYSSPSGSGTIGPGGELRFRVGEPLNVRIGALELGTAIAAPRLTVADFAGSAGGPSVSLRDPRVTNRARLIQALARAAGWVEVGPEIVAATERYGGEIRFEAAEEDFAASPGVQGLLSALGCELPTAAAARNHVRRRRAGIRKLANLRVPLRDGAELSADAYLPLDDAPRPVLLRLSIYGNAFGMGSIFSDTDRARAERREDRWFEDDKGHLGDIFRFAENLVSANATDWVPRGYAVVRVDGRGVGSSAGELKPFSTQEAEDYYDAIEWAAAQPWSDGNIGLFGASYAATLQWNVAVLAPPSLKAMMPFAGDVDSYRELAYPGGIFNEGYRRYWWTNLATQAARGPAASDFIEEILAEPFDRPEAYGPAGRVALTPDLGRVTVPFLTAISQTGVLHGRGGIEAFRYAPAAGKHLVVVDAAYYSFLYDDCLPMQTAFFDKHLKGRDVGPEELPPVRLIMRTGEGGFEWRDAADWPLPGTRYESFFLDAAAGALSEAAPARDSTLSYSADVPENDGGESGVSLVSEPLASSLDLAGHFTVDLWVSATTPDMDVYASLRVLRPDGAELSYPVRNADTSAPLTWGCLKVSQRATDPARSTVERPWHTHDRRDAALLTSPDEVVPITIELLPATGRIPAGARLRLDIQPVEGRGGFVNPLSGGPTRRAYEASYHDGAINRVHTGPGRPSRIVLPVVGPDHSRHKESHRG